MDHNLGQAGAKRPLETIAEQGQAAGKLGLLPLPDFQGGGHAHDQGNRLGAGAEARLMMPAEHQRRRWNVLAEQQGADAQRPAELMGGNAHGGHAQPVEIDRHLAHHFDGVGVQGDARAGAQRGQFLDRLEHARLVVAQQDADQAGVGGQQRGELLDADDALGRQAQGVHPPALLQEVFGRLDDALMLAGRNDDAAG